MEKLKLEKMYSCGADDNEASLMKNLMTNYDPGVRPAQNSSLPLTVIFGVSLHHIIDVDEKNQILTTNCWITQIWMDHHLKWNASDFAEINVIRIPYQRVWRPDLILYNNADPQYQSSVINTNVIVSSNGQVVWLSHGIYRSSCDINVEYFPFDVQSCHMKWSSWTYDGYQTLTMSRENNISSKKMLEWIVIFKESSCILINNHQYLISRIMVYLHIFYQQSSRFENLLSIKKINCIKNNIFLQKIKHINSHLVLKLENSTGRCFDPRYTTTITTTTTVTSNQIIRFPDSRSAICYEKSSNCRKFGS
ncbi:hypothetical protein ABEB36_004723 [Hypothenemus hampei]|uniref:Neurotransmitter-gated ion-channel ligand-binding domain-containing protein n=1 Tax=Hypothenemus hampei TaxID=57062 RepID=A0ABD1F486_HYPHA